MCTMSKDAISLCVKRQDFVDDPGLLQRLYLHHKGFTEIQNLDDFTQVKELFLESNSLTNIENLHNLKHLEVLHLEKNKIGKACIVRILFSIAFWIAYSHYDKTYNFREDPEFALCCQSEIPQFGPECNLKDRRARIPSLLGDVNYKSK